MRASRRRAVGLSAVLLASALLSAAPAGAATFADTAGTVHEAAVEDLVARGVTVGCDPQGALFCPAAPVSRAQMATFLVRALGLPPGSSDAFDDDDGSPHEASIDRVAEESIALGTGDGAFRPSEPVSRAQMAAFLVRAFALPGVAGNRFEDVSGTHAADVNALAAAGVTTGCNADGTRYCPTSPVTRGQMASFLSRALQLVDDAAPVDTGTGGGTVEGSGDGVAYATGGDAGELPQTSVPPPSYVGQVAVVEQSADAAEAYWTRTRTAAADAAVLTAAASAATPLYSGEPVLAGTSGWAASTVAQVGKLYFLKPDGRTGVCSGTVVRRGLVLTAAHCVVSSSGVDHTEFLFVPAMSGSSEPYGRWGASRAYYFTEYLQGGVADYVLDYALLHIPPTANGTWVGDLTGSFPVLLNSHALGLPRTALGYPRDGWYAQYGGLYLWSCSSSDVRWYDWGNGWASKGSGCSANGGFSGGPVFEHWNGAWYIASVNSHMSYPPSGGSRETHWLMNIWGPSLNSWYDALVDAVR